jgi:endonuclease III
MNFEDVFSFKHLDKITKYEEYWQSISPTNSNEIFKRWLFAYTSIHSTWQSNVRSYNHIKNFEQWLNDKSKLAELLYISRSGLHNQRTENIWDFKNKFFENPDSFEKSSSESWIDLRNRLAVNLKGIGLAKVSFALELCYPNNVEVVCLDVHMLRALKLNEQGYRADSKNIRIYEW